MSWECISYWIEHHPGLASWVQAVGALGAIYFAWRVARSQAVKIEKQISRRDVSRGGAVIQLLKHTRHTFESYMPLSMKYEDVERLRADIARLITVLDRVDLFDLPCIEMVNSVCVVRQHLEGVALKFEPSKNIVQRDMHAFGFRLQTGKRTIDLLSAQIENCESALATFS